MKNNKFLWLIVLLQLLGLLFIGYLFFTKETQQTAFISMGKVVSDFELSKELDAKIKVVQGARKNILDSLEIVVQQLSLKLQKNAASKKEQLEFDAKRQEYLLKQRQFTEDNQHLQQQYQEQIFKQLNQYIEEYNKDKDYDFIFGAAGNGVIMAAKPGNDITEEIIVFVNKRYKGAK